MTDPSVPSPPSWPPRPAPPLPTDPAWAQAYLPPAEPTPVAAPVADRTASTAPVAQEQTTAPAWMWEGMAAPTASSESADSDDDAAAAADPWAQPFRASGHAGGYRSSDAYGSAAGHDAPGSSASDAYGGYGPAGTPGSPDTTATQAYGSSWGHAAAGYPAAAASEAPVFTAPYAAPARSGWAPPPAAPTAVLGIVALGAAILAAVVATIVGGIASWLIGQGVGEQLGAGAGTGRLDPRLFESLRILSPVREIVLVAELSFYLGTALGVWAIVQGIIAIVKRRGRGFGIGAVIVAPLGFLAFVTVVWFALFLGLAAGAAGAATSGIAT